MAASLTAIAQLISAIGGTLSAPIAALLTVHSASASSIQQYLTELSLVADNPAEVASVADKIVATPGVAIDVAMVAEKLKVTVSAPGVTPMQAQALTMGTVGQLQNMIANANSNVLTNLLIGAAATPAAPVA